jgi:hypothetical protein
MPGLVQPSLGNATEQLDMRILEEVDMVVVDRKKIGLGRTDRHVSDFCIFEIQRSNDGEVDLRSILRLKVRCEAKTLHK